MKEKISIVIPIYKVEKYLKKCVDSIINQTYTNLEIILVDDGSPDNCPAMCDSYKKMDNRIVVIHKKNGGLSDARNYGMKIATGKWITFIDSDDYVDEDYIEYLYNLALMTNSDISIVLPQIFYDNQLEVKKTNKKEIIKEYNSEEALITMLYQNEFDTSAWGKLYKLNLFNDIDFPYGKLYEDISTIYKVILKSNKIAFSNQKKYYYLKRKDSIMGQKFQEKDMDYIYQAEEMYNLIKIMCNSEVENAAKCRLLNANFSILMKIKFSRNNKNYYNIIINNIKNLRHKILLNRNVRLKTKIAVLLSYIKII